MIGNQRNWRDTYDESLEGYELDLSEELEAARESVGKLDAKPWGDSRGDRTSFGYAYERDSTWHCGAEGRCKPCGKLYRNESGAVVCKQFDCYGCPSKAKQEAHVAHVWGKSMCRVCKKRRGWISLRTRKWYETQHKAAMAGEEIARLVRAPKVQLEVEP